MTDQIEQPACEPRSAAVNRTTKSATVQKLLSRNRGATLSEIMSTTHWQAHSARAFLTGLRKKGVILIRETRTTGDSSWRIEA